MTQASEDLERERYLCARAKDGDRRALGELLNRHGPRLYRSVLLPRLGSAAAAEDALSRTYTKVVEHIAGFEWQEVGIYPWLRVIALRVALDELRARRRERLFDPQDLEREIDDACPASAKEAEALERHDLAKARQRVEELLNQINPRYALAIRRRVLEQQSREALAAELGVSVATGDVVLHRAMTALRDALENRGGGL